MEKRALITGITGQDGAYLAKVLLEKGYKVFGVVRRLSTPNFWRLQYLDVLDEVDLIPADLVDSSSLLEAIEISEPDEVYHLAAQSFVGASFEEPVGAGVITGLGVPRILEGIRAINPKIKFYQASSSELYGNGSTEAQAENTPFHPASPYAAAKLYGYSITRIYREAYGIFACNGILFNHESPLRGLEFVTRKISNAVAKIALGIEHKLKLGNLEARRDWGYAPDYVKAMWLILQQKEPDDYVIATNESHSVQEFVEMAFTVAGLDWRRHLEVDKRFLRPLDVNYLQGNYSKAERKLGWKPEITFTSLVKLMVREDLDRWRRWQKGEHFAWDALTNPDNVKLLTRALRI